MIRPTQKNKNPIPALAHCGLIERVKGNWVFSIEANTNVAGSRDGDGVYRRMRHMRTIRCYANWAD